MKKIAMLLVLLLGVCGLILATGCGGQNEKKVALIFSHEPERWTTGAQMMQEQLKQDGVQVTLSIFTTDEDQAQALQEAVDAGANCIVLAGGDIKNIQAGLDAAKAKNIPVIDYDSLTLDTDAIAYYVTFDNYGVGEAMGKYIEQTKGLKKGQGPYTIEFFSGNAADINAKLMYQGAYDVLKPYIDKGQLVVPSGQQAYEQTATRNWDGKAAQARMTDLVQSQYAGRNLDIVVAASDSIAYGVIDGLAGYGGSWPLITGQDADKKALDYVRNGRMGFTIKKDALVLNQKCIRMIKAVLEGSQPEINNTTTYNNGVRIVPTYLCVPRIIDKNNLDES
ncbi:MAG: sugar ABC transporter substrate-binding protein [Selenomonadaceae bacterium]|nr:sugar ABC transporter substrate-binding protein [Selenomonadaceae bacterium]